MIGDRQTRAALDIKGPVLLNSNRWPVKWSVTLANVDQVQLVDAADTDAATVAV